MHIFIVLCLFSLFVIQGCGSSSSNAETFSYNKIFNNWQFDLTKPIPVTENNNSGYDHTVFYPMNYSISQDDPRLSSVGGNLCFPAVLAEAMIYLYNYRSPKVFPNLKLDGITPDHHWANPVAVVKQMSSLCKTSDKDGTNVFEAAICAQTFLKNSGYDMPEKFMIGNFNPMPNYPIDYDRRSPTISDIKNALDKGEVVLIGIGRVEVTDDGLFWHGGHEIGVYGYDQMSSWGDSRISLRVLDPHTQYTNDGNHLLYENLLVDAPIGKFKNPWGGSVISGPGMDQIGDNGKGRFVILSDVMHFLPL